MLQAYINLLVIIYTFFRVADLTLKQYAPISYDITNFSDFGT